MYEILEHTADIGLRIRAPNPERLFEDAARGLFALLVDKPEDIQPNDEIQIFLKEANIENLLVDWLSELLTIFETQKLILGHYEVKYNGEQLQAVCRGEKFDESRHTAYLSIKAVTYHRLRVYERSGEWTAEVILDI